MRVISGAAKGHKLFAPAGLSTRPTLDSVRESLFNILTGKISDCIFLDLFAGTGAVGIEALSRGAKHAVFVDKSKESIRVINKNLEKTGLMPNATIIHTDAISALRTLANKKAVFDFIYLDPPYGHDERFFHNLLEIITKTPLIDSNSICIIERQTKEKDLEYRDYGLTESKTKEYGNTKIIFLEQT